MERARREEAKQELNRIPAGADTMTIDVAVGRYWNEVGKHHVRAEETWHNLERLVDYLGPTRLLREITDEIVTELVAWRRGHSYNRKAEGSAELVSPATVNRTTTQFLQAIFTQAKKNWRCRFDAEPNWRRHRLAEPHERVRELHADEAERINDAMRADYAPFFDYARASGQRLNECLLKWTEIDWQAGMISKPGKGGRRVIVPITSVVRGILWPLRGHHPTHVFTYVAVRTRNGRVKGSRYPITYSGVKTMWRRIRKAARVEDFRFHDFRHDLATKLLRTTGNLKIVQKALNHADIKTTTRYAHVQTDEVAEALSKVQRSRNNSRSRLRKAI